MGRYALALMLWAAAFPAAAEAPAAVPRPLPRPVLDALPTTATDLVAVVSTAAVMGVTGDLRPRPRPADLIVAEVAAIDAASIVDLSALALAKPMARPDALLRDPTAETIAEPAILRLDPAPTVEPDKPHKKGWGIFKAAALRSPQSPEGLMPKKGSVCGDAAIRGKELAPVVSRVKGCGIDDPVEVTQIAGIRLSAPALVTCETARAAKRWIEDGLQPAFARDPVQVMHIAGSYVCRPRNGVRGNKVSEHGRGRALDISGFTLASGKVLSIDGDYRRSKPIKAAHKAACGPFGTTLGPGSDGHHEDHLHFDVANHRNGGYCR